MDFDANRINEKEELTKSRISFLKYISIFLFALFLANTINLFIISTVEIRGDSMEPTFTGQVGNYDRAFMVKVLKPKIYDVIVIDVFPNEDPYIKRVFGFEGDILWGEGGYLYRKYVDDKGQTVTQKFTSEPYVTTDKDGRFVDNFSPVTVGKGEVFFLGDNRFRSKDSRMVGCRPLENVLGVVPQWAINIKGFTKGYYNFLEKHLFGN